MSRFRPYKSGGKFYVKTTDTNGLAGGPYDSIEEADQRAANLSALEAKQAAVAAARSKESGANRMNIAPGYRSPDVEDGRFAPQPIMSSWSPDWWQHPPKLKDRPRGHAPPPWRHRIPFEGDPVYAPPSGPPPAPPYNLRDLGVPGGAFDMSPRPPWRIRIEDGKPKP